MKLLSLIEDLPGVLRKPDANPEVESLAYDSRAVLPGSLFFALPGLNVDGSKYVPMAAERGAVAAVASSDVETSLPLVLVEEPRQFMALAASKFFQSPSAALKVIGVTGTNGKTTTTFLIKHILDATSRPCGLIGTIHHSVGKQEEIPAQRTTPESIDLQEFLVRMRRSGCKACVMEVSSHALVQSRLEGIAFDLAVFTNLTQDHLDYHGTMEAYFEAKARLFDRLEKTGGKAPRAIVNLDDRFGHRLVDRIGKRVPILTYGLGAKADFRAKSIEMDAHGSSYALVARGREYLVRLPLIGLFNVYNSLAALTAAAAAGVEVRAAVAALQQAPQVPGRLQKVEAKRSFQVFVDYAHTPDALENVLRSLRELNPNRLLTVVGCGGDRDRSKRPLMAAAAESLSDHLILTSDNPRSENPFAILADMEKGIKGRSYEIVEDRAEAITKAIEMAAPGDMVLLAGKGHETYQEIAGQRRDFDDVKVAGWAIAEKQVTLE